MFCPKCGKELKENERFCSNCGTPVTKNAGVPQKKKQKSTILVGIVVVFLAFLLAVRILMPGFITGFFSDHSSGEEDDSGTVVKDSDNRVDKEDNDVKNLPTISEEDKSETQDNVNGMQDSIKFDTEFYTLELPEYWTDLSDYYQWDIEPYGYGLTFYEKQSRKDLNEIGGFLFSLSLYTDKEYEDWPGCIYLGQLNVIRLANYDVVVSYPTDVQFSEAGYENYVKLSNDIADILVSFTPRPDVDCEYTPAT